MTIDTSENDVRQEVPILLANDIKDANPSAAGLPTLCGHGAPDAGNGMKALEPAVHLNRYHVPT